MTLSDRTVVSDYPPRDYADLYTNGGRRTGTFLSDLILKVGMQYDV